MILGYGCKGEIHGVRDILNTRVSKGTKSSGSQRGGRATTSRRRDIQEGSTGMHQSVGNCFTFYYVRGSHGPIEST